MYGYVPDNTVYIPSAEKFYGFDWQNTIVWWINPGWYSKWHQAVFEIARAKRWGVTIYEVPMP